MLEILKKLGLAADHPACITLNFLLAVQGQDIPLTLLRRQHCGFILGRLAVLGEPVDQIFAKAWYSRIVAGTVTGNMSTEEIEERWAAFCFAVEGKPRLLFDEDLQRRVMLEFVWLPAPAEVWGLVKPEYEAFLTLVRTLNMILGRPIFAALPAAQEAMELCAELLAPRLVGLAPAPIRAAN